MTHWRKLTPKKSPYICAEDLDGKDYVVTIQRVIGGIVEDKQRGTKDKKAIATLEKAKKGLVLNATNCETIANMYGTDYEGWEGQRITIYPTMVQVGKNMMLGIRVRPQKPAAKAKEEVIDSPEREPGQEG